MPRFVIKPTDRDFLSTELIARDPSGALYLMERLGYSEADVFEDGQYKFSLRLNPGAVWLILQRKQNVAGKVVPVLAAMNKVATRQNVI